MSFGTSEPVVKEYIDDQHINNEFTYLRDQLDMMKQLCQQQVQQQLILVKKLRDQHQDNKKLKEDLEKAKVVQSTMDKNSGISIAAIHRYSDKKSRKEQREHYANIKATPKPN